MSKHEFVLVSHVSAVTNAKLEEVQQLSSKYLFLGVSFSSDLKKYEYRLNSGTPIAFLS